MTRRLLLIAGLLASLPAYGQTAFLVKDIRTGTPPAEWPSGIEIAELGGIAYFRGDDRIHGSELWRSDGTAAGTTLVRDVCPGVCSSTPSELTVVGSTIYFRADDGAHGPSLWKSEGTAAGTVLVKAVEPSRLAAFGGLIAFAAASPSEGQELWRSDGTVAGTLPLGDLRPGLEGSSPHPLGELAGVLLFHADDGTHGRELWKTDGTGAGTLFVEDTNPGPDPGFPAPSFPEHSAAAGGRLLFRTIGSSGFPQLWASDGTAPGTARLGTVAPYLEIGAPFAYLGGLAYFGGSDGLWKSDGTENGTVQVAEAPGDALLELTAAGDRLFFRPYDTLGFLSFPLWSSDGTEAGTAAVPLPSGLAGLGQILALGDEVIFYGFFSGLGVEPWRTDGTEAGTVLIGDLNPGDESSQAGSGLVVGGLWLFQARTPDGLSLWASDGTPTGTGLVKRLDESDASGLKPELPGLHSMPIKADLAGTLILSADSGLPGEIWRSDGTEAGTTLVKEIDSGTPVELTPLDKRIFFSTGTGNLWSSDGTEAGTRSYPDIYTHDLTPAGGQLYFAISSFIDEIRRIGPSELDTARVKAINPGILQKLTAAGPRLFFHALEEGVYGLWTSDGTEAGTVQVPGVPPPDELAAHRGALVFSASDAAAGRELWISDGGITGTAGNHRVQDIRPGTGSSNPRRLTSAGSLVFFTADDGTAGEELWKSDGTEVGTVRVADIRPGSETSWIRELTAAGDRVFFAADDGIHGVELWVSDGTAIGTHIVKDVVPGAGSSYPRYLQVAGHRLYFAADDGVHGLEPWTTDGTEAGTVLLQDVNPGAAPSTPTGFVISGPWLYFTANDGAHGFELWAMDRAADFHTVPPCRVFDTRSTSALPSGAARTFPVAGTCGVPAGAQAVAVNLTVIGATGNGRVVVYPAGPAVPVTSSLNFQTGLTRANNGVIGLTLGEVDALATVSGAGTVHLLLDVSGYYE
ncbi:MAG: ELWxxDGT repeat protein [Acidobacteriota bacterium]